MSNKSELEDAVTSFKTKTNKIRTRDGSDVI